ncbi:MAG TPA: winged helix-turn-helix domain-containing protein [Edaphobacter sp.]|jgi:TolB-like protein/DNA-binding winged helix-turn-helix (wHTH) protein/tetratricopeptide (TPR) repeat protein|nr:winged helix-turn-helix domain-containing protein [Edaphobacter sp.]
MEHFVRNARSYRFDIFTLDVRTGELTRGGVRLPLREQSLQLLLVLLEQPGELVTREVLVSRLWPAGTFVDFDRGLNKAINYLRETLGDSADEPRFVETLPRKGYRFIAPVTRDDATLEETAPARRRRKSRTWMIALGTAAVCFGILLGVLLGANVGGVRDWVAMRWRSTPQISALAVIPLENLSRDPEQEYFADGITDDLITNLAKVSNVRISSRTSIIRYKGTKKSIKDIGRELHVDAVVEGTVMRSGNRIRITAQLIQVSTDMHLWAEAYERDVSEILTVQNEVATDIARRVSALVRPLGRAPRVNPEAYGSYLKGRYFFYQYTNLGWQQSIDSFNRAVASDPNFALAYSGLADAYLVAGAYNAIRSTEALAHGKAAAAHALELDGNLAAAHYALATAYAWYDWDWKNAEKEFQRALELDPNDALGRNWYGGYLSLRGRHDEAVDEHERARQLDPFSLIINANLARSLYWARRYDEAIVQARRTLQMDPRFYVALFWLEGSLRHKNLYREAVALRLAISTPERAQSIEHTFKMGGFQAVLREDGENFKNNGELISAARCFAQIGEKNEALSLLEDCYEHRCSSMATLKAEPDFDVLRSEIRFQSLLEKLGVLEENLPPKDKSPR